MKKILFSMFSILILSANLAFASKGFRHLEFVVSKSGNEDFKVYFDANRTILRHPAIDDQCREVARVLETNPAQAFEALDLALAAYQQALAEEDYLPLSNQFVHVVSLRLEQLFFSVYLAQRSNHSQASYFETSDPVTIRIQKRIDEVFKLTDAEIKSEYSKIIHKGKPLGVPRLSNFVEVFEARARLVLSDFMYRIAQHELLASELNIGLAERKQALLQKRVLTEAQSLSPELPGPVFDQVIDLIFKDPAKIYRTQASRLVKGEAVRDLEQAAQTQANQIAYRFASTHPSDIGLAPPAEKSKNEKACLIEAFVALNPGREDAARAAAEKMDIPSLIRRLKNAQIGKKPT